MSRQSVMPHFAARCGLLLGLMAVGPSFGQTYYPAVPVAAEVPLPAGMVDEHDADESGDPRGLPRVADYVISSIGRHTLADKVPDAQGRQTEVPLGRVETREYRLDRYAKRPPSPPEAILRHYHRQIEVLGGSVLSQSTERMTAQFLRGEAPVVVTLKVKSDGKRYELITGGPGALKGTTTVPISPSADSHPHHDSQSTHPSHEQSGHRPTPGGEASSRARADAAPVDARPIATTGFRMPPEATLWPPRGTRGMAVLLVGAGVHRVTAVRFGTSDAEILARETARVRVRVPMLPDDVVPVTLVYAHGEERLRVPFQVLDTPQVDAAAVTVPPCDSRPEMAGGISAGVGEIQPQQVRPGQRLKLSGRRLEGVTHVTFTVARHEVDPAITGVNPDLIGIDFGAAGKARSAPRWLDTLAANIGRSFGARPSVAGECDPNNLSGYAAVRHTADREMEVCVPPLALSGPIGLWRADGKSGDACETSDMPVRVMRSALPLPQ